MLIRRVTLKPIEPILKKTKFKLQNMVKIMKINKIMK